MREWLSGLTDQRIDSVIGTLLRIGVSLAALVVLVGGAVYLSQHASARPSYGTFHGQPAALRSVTGIIGEATKLSDGRGVIQLGLLLLIATPMARVLFTVIAFAVQRDVIYVIVTVIVLSILVYGFVGHV